MGKLGGKAALITGGTSGIGMATAKWFIAEGAHVYVTGSLHENVDKAVKSLGRNSLLQRWPDNAVVACKNNLEDTVFHTEGFVIMATSAFGALLVPASLRSPPARLELDPERDLQSFLLSAT